MSTTLPRIVCLAVFLVISFASTSSRMQAAEGPAAPIDFNRQIRTILSDKCFLCHGPDESTRQADLRLDLEQTAKREIDGVAPIKPGDLEHSEVLNRILSTDASIQMPPPEHGKSLTPAQVELLKQWISQGAPWATHWAFTAPVRPEVPSAATSEWTASPIDQFILQKLASNQLAPNPPAEEASLIRRVYLDLTGLPPTLEELDAYLESENREKYQQLVDQLLASPRYGERWGREWLDAARYSDSDGYEKDSPRISWLYRDWVVNAMNADMPYNEFVTQQIAGDLLPNATIEQKIATGFLRNSMVNEEGGADAEQFRIEGMFDRMDAIGKAILGVTTQCAQCHTHKYDPLTHAEYYQMFAFLNNVYEADVVYHSPAQREQIKAIQAQVHQLEQQAKAQRPDWSEKLFAWVEQQRTQLPSWHRVQLERRSYDGQKFRFLDDKSVISESYAPTFSDDEFYGDLPAGTSFQWVRLELLTHPQLPSSGPGRALNGTNSLSELDLYLLDQDGKATELAWESIVADVNPATKTVDGLHYIPSQDKDKPRTSGPAQFAIDNDIKTGWSTDSGPADRNQSRHAVLKLKDRVLMPEGSRLIVTLRQKHGGDDSDNKENNIIGRFRVSISDDPLLLTQKDQLLPWAVDDLLHTERVRWTAENWQTVFEYWRTLQADLDPLNQQIADALKQFPEPTTQLVVQERPHPRQSHILSRGDFLKPTAAVNPGVPSFLNAMPQTAEPDRLRFARWMASKDSPTTARVIVNRIWQAYFGTGFVSTPEDLGTQSDPPSHPELLDWLACELMENGWSLKHLHRLIVASSAYRQSAYVSPEKLERDPANRLVSRGPSFRLPAEMIRDSALYNAGLLDLTMGGPSVFPDAPAFLFQKPASYSNKQWDSHLPGQQYRRSMYTFWFRSVNHPVLQVFDAPKADVACVKRPRSNTPMQALTTLNEISFLRASHALAARVLKIDPTANDEARLAYAFRICTSRTPEPDEMSVLTDLLKTQRDYYTKTPQAAEDLVKHSVPREAEEKCNLSGSTISIVEHAAWITMTRTLLNLDESLSK
ncbi:PSD1 and planctomycete cytochrome C domain-containing protein [Lacunimicrobium album]